MAKPYHHERSVLLNSCGPRIERCSTHSAPGSNTASGLNIAANNPAVILLCFITILPPYMACRGAVFRPIPAHLNITGSVPLLFQQCGCPSLRMGEHCSQSSDTRVGHGTAGATLSSDHTRYSARLQDSTAATGRVAHLFRGAGHGRVAHLFRGGGHEWVADSRPPRLKPWATRRPWPT